MDDLPRQRQGTKLLIDATRKARQRQESVVARYRLDNIDQILLKQLVEFPHCTNRELAALVELSVTAVKKRRGKPVFQKAFSELLQTTDEALNGLAHFALKRLRQLAVSEDERVSLEACKAIWGAYKDRQSSSMPSARLIYEVQFGKEGQLFKQILNEGEPQQLPTTLDLVVA